MASRDRIYEMQVYQSGQKGKEKQIVVYIFKKSNHYTDAQLAYLEGEKEKLGLCWIFTKGFNCKDLSSNRLKIILKTEYSPRIKEIDRSKVDAMSLGVKKIFTIPSNATFLEAIIIDEEDRLLLNESLHDKVLQLLSSQESSPGVEGDDMTELVHQYICMMLLVYTLYSSLMRQPLFR